MPDRTPFIGRRRELALLSGEMQRGARLLTITGPSGMGKTRLARQLLQENAADFLGGAKFCSLASSRSPADLEAAVAGALGIPQQPGVDLAVALANHGSMLLVLDNLDEVASGAASVLGRWLDHCPDLQLLITSIVPIAMEGEVRVEMGPLEVDDAIALYLERANRAWAGKTFAEGDQAAIQELVTRLDRSPLAIELAAARVRVLAPRALLARIDDRFDLLHSDRPGRHRSLLSAIAFTWELLSKDERSALMRVSTFSGGFTFEAAEALLGDIPAMTLDLLDDLRSKALLQAEEGDPPRFSLFESVRDFAFLELQRSGEEERILRIHATYFVREGERRCRDLQGPSPLPSIRWLQGERKNLIAAHRSFLPLDPRLAAEVGHVLVLLLEFEGPPASEMELLDSAIDAARRSSDPELLIRGLRYRSVTLTRIGRMREASVDSQEGLQLARLHGDEVSEGHLLVNVARHQTLAGSLEAAEETLHQALRLAERNGARLLAGASQVVMGLLNDVRGTQEESERSCQQALDIYREIDFILGQGHALIMLGAAQVGQGKFNEARAAFREAFRIFSTNEAVTGEADATLNLGGVEATAGRLDEAEFHVNRALELQRVTGNLRHQGTTILNLASIAMQRGQWRRAELHLQESLLIFESAGDRRYHAEAHWLLAIVDAVAGRESEARQSLRRAAQYYREAADPSLAARESLVDAFLERARAEGLRDKGQAVEAAALQESSAARVAQITERERMNEGLLGMLRLYRQPLPREGAAPAAAGVHQPARSLMVGPDAEWFEFDGKRADLRRRRTARRMLEGLLELHRTAPGDGLSKEALFEIGWEGEQIRPDAAASRVYVGVQTLRSLGLEGALQRNFQGYFIDPTITIHRMGSEAA